MFTLWTTVASWLGGCIGIPAAERSTAGVPDAAAKEGDIVQASFDEPAQADTLLRPRTPSFPQQGWWCGEFSDWLTPDRAEHGYTIILPGIEGTSWFNISVARGLVDAGHDRAIEISDWTTGYWPMFVYHLMALERNREQAREIAERIIAYQDRYPGRPVTLIGHSGGAAMAVLVLESLPVDRQVTQAVLLAGALSPDYDLSTALARTENGIRNYYSGGDALYLIAGTLALGTIDRQHAVSAGAIGFRTPDNLPSEQRELYESKLRQEPYRLEMFSSWNFGGHFGPVNRRFVAKWVAPELR
jgi:pimeloyl-ACP methyl ester carboxylesterase